MKLHVSHSIRMAVLQKKKKKTANRCLSGCREKRTFVQGWWEYRLVQPLWETLEARKNKWNHYVEEISAPPCPFIAILFTTAETWKQTVYSLRDEQRKCGIYRNNGICYSHKEKEILPFVTTLMDLEGIMLSEISQRKTYTVWSHLYVESKIEH